MTSNTMMIAVPTTSTRDPTTLTMLSEAGVPNVYAFDQGYGLHKELSGISYVDCAINTSKISNLYVAANLAYDLGFEYILTIDDDMKYLSKQVGTKFEKKNEAKEGLYDTIDLIKTNSNTDYDCIGLKFPFPNDHEWVRQPKDVSISTSCFALWDVSSLIKCINLIKDKNILQTLRLGDDTMLAGALAQLDMKYGQFQHIKPVFDIVSTITGIGSTIHSEDTYHEIDNILALYDRVEYTYPHLNWQVSPEGLPTKPSKTSHKQNILGYAYDMPMKRVKFQEVYWAYFLDGLSYRYSPTFNM